MFENLCPHCGSIRDPVLTKPCTSCGSRKIPVFGYIYPHEIKTVRLATIIIIAFLLVALVLGIGYRLLAIKLLAY